RVENDRRQLRLVCRHWKAIADTLSINVAFTDFVEIAPISEGCVPRDSRLEGCIKVAPPQPGGGTLKPFPDSPSTLERIQVISSGAFYNFGRLLDPRHINSAPNLRALGVHANSLEGVTTLDYLTHLSIHDVSGRETLGTIRLPCLRCLYLKLDLDRSNKVEAWKPFDRWVFPKVTFLCVSGTVETEIQYDGLRRFIGNHARTLEDLILVHNVVLGPSHGLWHRNECHTVTIRDLQQQYRHLKVLGLDTLGLRVVGGINEAGPADSLPPPPPPSSLLIRDIGNLPGLYDAGMIAEQYLSLATHPMTNFDKIVITHSWKQIVQEWKSCVTAGMLWNPDYWRTVDILDSPREFFRVFYRAKISFVDRDGVDLREEDGLQVLEMLGLTHSD
ncbi:hypothetical protein FRC14_002435, partial [Serendipita sp. 396]